MMPTPAWITIERATGAHWQLTDFEYHPDGHEDNDGTINVYVLAFDRDNKPTAKVQLLEIWGDGTTVAHPFKQNAAGQMQSDFGMYNSFDPGKGQVGPYSARLSENSDTVRGLGLPLNRHVQYWLVYKETDAGTVPPVEPPVVGPPSPSDEYVTRAELREILLGALAKLG